MSELDPIVENIIGQTSAAHAQAVSGMESSPDEAARSMELSQLSGIPAPAILTDLPEFEASQKRKMATEIIRNNHHLVDYVNADPMHSRLSSDDYGNLDQTSAALTKLNAGGFWAGLGASKLGPFGPEGPTGNDSIGKSALQGAIEGFKEGFGEGPMGSWIKADDREKYPFLAELAEKLEVDLPLRLLGGVFTGMSHAIGKGGGYFLRQTTGDNANADLFERDMTAMADAYFMGMTGYHGPAKPTEGGLFPRGEKPKAKEPPPLTPEQEHFAKSVEEVRQIAKDIQPWLESGQEPPYGINKHIDRLKEEQSKLDLKNLDEATKAAQSSATRERNPDVFAGFIRQHTDASIGISGDAVAKLYGDKIPEIGDNILGWSPRIVEELAVARETGGDVQIPLADWLARIDPEVAKVLHDDIRVRPGNVTKVEQEFAKEHKEAVKATSEEVTGEKQVLPEPLQQLRSSTGLEPLFSIGDRKLALERVKAEQGERHTPESLAAANGETITDANRRYYEVQAESVNTNQPGKFGPAQGFHDFEIKDEHGRGVGFLNLSEAKGGKQLYIDMISGTGGLGPTAFGPALMRDLLRQLKAEFPEAETITGHRVSGARDKAGSFDQPSALPVIKLDIADLKVGDFDKFTDLVGGAWRDEQSGFKSYLKPELAEHEAAIREAVLDELDRIVPKQVGAEVVSAIRGKDGRSPMGMYQQFVETFPNILISLEGRDSVGTARHEAIHHLRQYGFLNEGEWNVLARAARDGDWLKKYGIEERYSTLDMPNKLEEAVADGYADWRAGKDKEIPEAVQRVFQKIAEFFDRVLERIGQALGKEVTWEQIFRKIDEGEIGGREGNKPLDVRAYSESVGEPPPIPEAQQKAAFEKASAAGMTADFYKRYNRLMDKRNAEDLAHAMEKAEKQQRKEQTAEWKEAKKAMKAEVEVDIRNRPDVAADLYFTSGDLYGEKTGKPIKLDPTTVSPDALTMLPKEYFGKDGVHPDDVASMFGYPSGAAMLQRLSQYTEARRTGKMSSKDFIKRIVDIETDRQMEAKFSNLEKSILDEARDQAYSATQVDILHEEMLKLASDANLEFSMTKEQIVSAVEEAFAKSPIKGISVEKFERDMAKASKAMELGHLKEDPTEAFRQKQRQMLSTLFVREAMKFEKAEAQLAKTAKRYSGRDVPKNVEKEYGNFAQALLSEAGYTMRLSPDEIARAIDFEGYKSLDSFVAEKTSHGIELEVKEGYAPKPLDKMTVEEFNELKAAVDTLDHAGKDAKKIIVAGEKMDKDAWIAEAEAVLKQRPISKEGGNWLYGLDASMTRVEQLAKSFDFHEEMGPFFKALIVPFEMSKSKSFDMLTDLGKKIKDWQGGDKVWQKTLKDVIPQDFVYDLRNETMFELTRWNMIKMMMNFGTESNFNTLAKGIASAKLGGKIADATQTAAMRARIESWIHANAKPEDWKFVQNVLDQFKQWQPEADTLFRNLSGNPPKWIPARAIDTPHGQFAGGYFPLIPDMTRMIGAGIRDKGAVDGSGPLGKNYYRATTATPFYKERTGATYFVDITNGIENLAGRMQQVIHDLSYRDFVVNASKIIYDPRVKNMIEKYYGPQYLAQLEPWLKRVANEYTGMEVELQGWNDVLRKTKANLVAYALPLNYSVMLSPSVGMGNIKQLIAFNADRAANKKLVMENSRELQHLMFNLDRDVTEQLTRAANARGWTSFQKAAVEKMFRPLTWLEQQTRMVTFWGEYMAQKEKGRSDFEASTMADSRIRKEHGTAALGDLPALMASKNQFVQVATVFMGYFSTQRNWLREVPDQFRRGDISGMTKTLWGTIGIAAAFNAALFTRRKENDTVFSFLARAVLSTPLSMVPYARDVWSYYTEGYQSRAPIVSMFESVGKLGKDGYDLYQGKQLKTPVRDVAAGMGQVIGFPGALQVGRTAGFYHDVARGRQHPKDVVEWMRGILTGEAKLKR